MDKGKVTAFALLNLSAAFDNIDHNTLIISLSMWYGISGTALNWFSSYLADNYQSLKITTGVIAFQGHYPLHVVFLRVLFLDHYFLLFTLLHSAQLFKLTTWTTAYMQMIHRFTFPWPPLFLKPALGLFLAQ